MLTNHAYFNLGGAVRYHATQPWYSLIHRAIRQSQIIELLSTQMSIYRRMEIIWHWESRRLFVGTFNWNLNFFCSQVSGKHDLREPGINFPDNSNYDGAFVIDGGGLREAARWGIIMNNQYSSSSFPITLRCVMKPDRTRMTGVHKTAFSVVHRAVNIIFNFKILSTTTSWNNISRITSQTSGLQLRVLTDQPCMHLYSAFWLHPKGLGKGGVGELSWDGSLKLWFDGR